MQWDENSSDANGDFTDSDSAEPGYVTETDTYALEAESAGYAELDQAHGEPVLCEPTENEGYESSGLDYAPTEVAEQPETVNGDSSQQYGVPDGYSVPDAEDLTVSQDEFSAPVETTTGPLGGADLVITPDSGGAGTPPTTINPFTGQPGGVDLVITPDSGGAGTPPTTINPLTGQPGGANIVIAPPPSGAVGPAGPLFNSPVIMNDPNGARIVNEIQSSWDRAVQAWTVPDGFRYGPR